MQLFFPVMNFHQAHSDACSSKCPWIIERQRHLHSCCRGRIRATPIVFVQFKGVQASLGLGKDNPPTYMHSSKRKVCWYLIAINSYSLDPDNFNHKGRAEHISGLYRCISTIPFFAATVFKRSKRHQLCNMIQCQEMKDLTSRPKA